ncbi:EAL domain-containing protein [Cloacibacillus sp.]
MWDAKEHCCAKIPGGGDITKLFFQYCGGSCEETDEALAAFVEGMFKGRERDRMICSFSAAGGERWRAEVSYKSLIEDSGGHSRSVCLMRRLRMEEETRSFCAEHRACLDDWLNRGIKNGFVKLYLQPKMNLTRQEITGAEVLARYEDPRKGLLAPDDFIPQLEDAGLIGALDLYIMERSYRLLCDFRAAGLKLVPLSVNFSKKTLLAPGILDEVERIGAGFGDLREYMEIEVTESVGNVSRPDFAAACTALRAAGYRLALDDFGSEYSNLYMMQAFRFDVIKIDKAVVAEVADNEISRALVESTVNICGKLDIGCIAEGVESKDQAEILAALGCPDVQGYLIDRPLPSEEFAAKYLGGR